MGVFPEWRQPKVFQQEDLRHLKAVSKRAGWLLASFRWCPSWWTEWTTRSWCLNQVARTSILLSVMISDGSDFLRRQEDTEGIQKKIESMLIHESCGFRIVFCWVIVALFKLQDSAAKKLELELVRYFLHSVDPVHFWSYIYQFSPFFNVESIRSDKDRLRALSKRLAARGIASQQRLSQQRVCQ